MAVQRKPGPLCLFRGGQAVTGPLRPTYAAPGILGAWPFVQKCPWGLDLDFPLATESTSTTSTKPQAQPGPKPDVPPQPPAAGVTLAKSFAIDLFRLVEICDQMTAAGVTYLLNGKAIPLDQPLPSIKALDCSGFTQYAIYHASLLKIRIPAGSVRQREWCEREQLPRVDYNTQAGLLDCRLRMAFLSPKNGHHGHVWFVLQGLTIECSTTGRGPRRLLWNRCPLPQADACYLLA